MVTVATCRSVRDRQKRIMFGGLTAFAGLKEGLLYSLYQGLRLSCGGFGGRTDVGTISELVLRTLSFVYTPAPKPPTAQWMISTYRQ